MSRLIVREEAQGELSLMLHELTLHELLFAKGIGTSFFRKTLACSGSTGGQNLASGLRWNRAVGRPHGLFEETANA